MVLPVELRVKILEYTLENVDYEQYKTILEDNRELITRNNIIYNINSLTEALENINNEMMFEPDISYDDLTDNVNSLAIARNILKKYTKYSDIFEYDYEYYRKIIYYNTDHIDFNVQLYRLYKNKNNSSIASHNNCFYEMILGQMKSYNKDLFTKLNNI